MGNYTSTAQTPSVFIKHVAAALPLSYPSVSETLNARATQTSLLLTAPGKGNEFKWVSLTAFHGEIENSYFQLSSGKMTSLGKSSVDQSKWFTLPADDITSYDSYIAGLLC